MSVPSDTDPNDGRDRHGDGATASVDTCEDTPVDSGVNDEIIEVKPILKRKSLDESEIKTLPSILKKRDSLDLSSKTTTSISFPKRHSLGSESDQRNPQLFVTTSSASGVRDISSTPSSTKPSSQIHSILKHKSFDEKCIHSKEDHSMPKPILKKNLSIEDQIEKSLSLKNGTNGANSSTVSPTHSTRSILKSGSEDKVFANKPIGVKSILKNKNDRNDAKPVRSALKKSDQSLDKDSKVKSILKSESMGSSTEKINSYDSSSSSSCEDLVSSVSPSVETSERSAEPASDHRNGHSMVDEKQSDDKKPNERFLTNNIKLDHKRPSSCILMSATKPIDIDVEPKASTNGTKNGSSGRSITERMAALQRNGEEMWKKRVQKDEELGVQLRDKPNVPNRLRATSIADRLSLLEDSSLKWKNRVEEKDAKKFTVEGKMSESDAPVLQTPDVQRKTPKAKTFRSEKSQDLLNSIKTDQTVVPKLITPEMDCQTPNSSKKEVVVSVLKPDDEDFDSFFNKEVKLRNQENESISDDVFDEISAGVSDLLAQKKSVKVQGRRRTASSNPIRSLAARTDFIVDSYVESTCNQSIDTKGDDPKAKKTNELAKRSSFAPAALAGLASREDIKAVAGRLRNSMTSTRDTWKSYDMPNSMQDLMLVQVKGRRRVQTRLVEPKIDSISSGDSYVLVSKDRVIVWIGEFSNVIERTKTIEIGNTIHEKKDLCFRLSNPLILIDNQKPEKIDKINEKLFRKLLGSVGEISPPKNPEEDEQYEEVIIGTNLIYRVIKEKLVPYDDYWGRLPKYEMLSSEEAFVFDFGSEMYVWVGNRTSNIVRKCALDSAKDLWNKGYDYSECDISPLGVNVPKKCETRPKWAWFMKASQNMETILFREKFVNWPSSPSTPSAIRTPKNNDKCIFNFKDISSTAADYDIKELMAFEAPEPDLILENSHLGRGVRWDDELEGRHFTITSLAAKCWHISDYEKHELSERDMNYFHSGDTYVVRWHYRIARVGRELKTGNESRHSLRGRDRMCYFFWHGAGTKSTEKGASALMTIELDKEKAQQVRVSERREDPCFVNVFKGAFVILLGKRGQTPTDKWRMFYLRGLFANESSLVEVECKVENLRSRTAFLFINASNHVMYVWNGSKILDHVREVMESAVENLIKFKSSEIGLNSDVNYLIKRLDEGKEVKDFWNIFGSNPTKDHRKLYHSLIDSHHSYSYTPRLFHLSSSSGEFKPKEILCSLRSSTKANAYPFDQGDIYGAQQPTFFLLDDDSQIFLWESKFAFTNQPGLDPEATATTGSAELRWTVDRKFALDFAQAYCLAKNSAQPPNALVITAGLEPDSFCALFPQWTLREDVALMHIQDGRKVGETVSVGELLSQMKEPGSVVYSIDELRKRPEGVNLLCLESYLSDHDFKAVLGMTRPEFYGLPDWRQTSLKQSAQLF